MRSSVLSLNLVFLLSASLVGASTAHAQQGGNGRVISPRKPARRIEAVTPPVQSLLRKLSVRVPAPQAHPKQRRITKAKTTHKKPFESLLAKGANQRGPVWSLAASRVDSLVGQARTLVGLRYVWGGERPASGLDCSGLVRYLFGRYGIEVPHRASLLANLGDPISRDTAAMRPGDLLYFGVPRRVHHVGLYVGDGMMVHAANRNRGVVIDSVPATGDAGTRRHMWRGWLGVRRLTTAAEAPARLPLEF